MQLEFIPVDGDERLRALSDLADRIWHEYFPFLLSAKQIDYMVEKFQSYDAIARQIADGYEYYLIAASGAPIGYIGVRYDPQALFLSKLYLRADCRGKGYASQAFAFVSALARKRSLPAIELTCNKHNEHSLDVYRKKGFQIVSSEVTDIGEGYVMDDYVMRLDPA